MADPFSVAGTAVGITSLGIQTCQILFRYYSQYRGFHGDIEDIVRRVEGLEGILRALEKILEKVQIDNHEPSSQLRLALKACEEVNERLRRAAEECGASKNISSYKDRLQLFKKRSQWPLKQGPLKEISSNLDKFQDNLNLALQVLGLDINLQKFDHLESATKEIGDRTSRMESHILSQFDALQRMQGGLEQLVYYQQEQNSRVQEDFSNIRTTICAQGASTEQKLDLIIHTLTKFQTSSTIAPSFLAETIDTVRNTRPQLRKNLRRYKASAHWVDFSDSQIARMHSCQCRPRNRQLVERKGWIHLYSADTYDHETHCPQHRYADFSRTTAAKIVVCNRILQFCVLVGWQQSRRSGWISSIPVLQYRAVVPSNSPVFRTVTGSKLYKKPYRVGSRKELERELAAIMNGLRECFKDKARPTDIDEYGNGIAVTLVSLVCKLISSRRVTDIDIFLSFLDATFEEGIPWNGKDSGGRTCIEYFQSLSFYHTRSDPGDSAEIIFCHLVRRIRSWNAPLSEREYFGWSQYLFDNVSNFLKSDEMCETFDAETSLLESILGRMDSEFLAILVSGSPGGLASMLATAQYASPLASWPEGLKVLLTSNIINGYDGVMTRLWEEALHLINPESIELLICHGIQPTLLDWYSIHTWELRNILLSENSLRYKKMFLKLAQQLHYTWLDVVPDMLSAAEPDETTEFLPYHMDNLTIESAESLWESDHRCIDRVGRCHSDFIREYEADLICTPLWACSIRSEGWKKEYWELMKWFLRKGANLYWVHPYYRTTPAHNMSRNFIDVAFPRGHGGKGDELLEEIYKILEAPNRDNCWCYCSQGGCCAIGISSSKYIAGNLRPVMFYIRRHKGYVPSYLSELIEKNPGFRWMSSSILRVKTFERLSLNHTCCYRIEDEVKGRFNRPTTEEAKVIHDIERDEIDLLEKLMVDFEQAWQQYTGTFSNFMKKVWKPRMREEIQKMKQPTAEEAFRQTGVRLKKPKELAEERAQESEEDVSTEDDYSEDDYSEDDYSDDIDNDDENDGYATAAED